MASKSEYRSNRSVYRENRAAIKEMVDRQNSAIDREFLITSSLFRTFFLLGSLALLIADRNALVGAIPLFTIVTFAWLYRTMLNNKVSYYAIRWTEKLLSHELNRYAHENVLDEENDQGFIDDLIRIRTMRPDSALQLYLEPAALLVASLALIYFRLSPLPLF